MYQEKVSGIEYKYFRSKIDEGLNEIGQLLRYTYTQTYKEDIEQIAYKLLLKPYNMGNSRVNPCKLLNDTNEQYKDYFYSQMDRYKCKVIKDNVVITNEKLAYDLLQEHDKYVPDSYAYKLSMFKMMDNIAVLRFLYFINDDNKHKQIYKTMLNTNKSFSDLLALSEELYWYRSQIIAHADGTGEMERAKVFDFTKYITETLESFNKNIQSNYSQQIKDIATNIKNKLNCKPLTIYQLQSNYPAISETYLKESKFAEHIDFKNKIIYLHTIQEIKNNYEVLLGNKLIQRQFNSQENIPSTAIETIQLCKPLKTLYDIDITDTKQTYLADNQLNEVFNESVIFVDASMLLDDDSRKYFSRMAENYFPKFGIIPNVTYQTRLELFKIEKDEKKSQAIRDNAKYARTKLKSLHEHGLLNYAPSSSSVNNAHEDFIFNYALKNKERRFVVLENLRFSLVNKSTEAFEKELKDNSVINMLPLYWISHIKDVIRYKFNVKSNYTFSNFIKLGEPPEAEVEPEAEETVIEIDNQSPVIAKKKNKATVKKDITAYDLKVENNYLIPIDHVAQSGDTVYQDNSSRNPSVLGEELGKGGEGTVFAVGKIAVAKIYRPEKLTRFKQEKINEIIQLQKLNSYFAIPSRALLNEDSQFVGFLMKRLSDSYKPLATSVLKIGNDTLRQKEMSKWKRNHLVDVCIQISYAVKLAHENGLVIGDMNKNNIMVNYTQLNNIKICFVDCDSMQYKGYPCPVGKVDFTNPEIYIRLNNENPSYANFLRTIDDDMYALAIMLFRILMLDTSPFDSKKDSTDLKEKMMHYNFEFKNEVNNSSGKDAPTGVGQMIWNNTPKRLKNLFVSEFTHQGHIAIEEWINALQDYKKKILNKTYTDEIIPNKYFDTKEHEFNTDFVCQSCGAETNMPKVRYENKIKYKEILLCPACTQALNTLKTIPFTPENDAIYGKDCKCSCCKKDFKAKNYYDVYMSKNSESYKVYCEECEAPIQVLCHRCRKTVSFAHKYIYQKRKKNYNHFICDDCVSKIIEAKNKKG